MPIERYLISIDDGIMSIDSHCPMVMRERESQDLAVNLVSTPHVPKQLDDPSHGKSHAVRILPVGNIECSGTLNLTCQKGKVHVEGAQKEGAVGVRVVSKKGFEFFQLVVCERRSVKCDGVVGLREWSVEGDRRSPALIDTLN
ncbi:hypothetical protein H113_09041 [Trichophyton rubrum MR1459]|nr:hypothetical protein H113_09041 [Trichophyton rubrum MR1459]EZG00825.1 hypothetical protein H106_08846 [Trichophyton rubrum CBS 735.88]